ncbi:MAG: hypothetical protein DRP85_07415 [Candidatus Makaraimicrobium thalassicum]|nr:MAG: hypothetical protein DRP85_07415 [Candidatus Omnitrophota bacterium]
MKKVFVFGFLAAMLFVVLGQGTCAFVNHFQALGLNLMNPDASSQMNSESMSTIDIVRSSMAELDNSIVKGHGCYGENEACTPTLGSCCPVVYGAFTSHTAINLYSSIQIVDRGYVLKDGDMFCSDDELEAKYENNGGEWFTKGGPSDTPPIQWMSCSELKDMLTHLVKWHKTNVYPDDYRPISTDSPPESYVVNNDAINRDDIVVHRTMVSTLISTHQNVRLVSYLSVLCCLDEPSSLAEKEDKGEYSYEINFNPKCIMYFDSLYSLNGLWGEKPKAPSFLKYNYLPEFKPLIFGKASYGRNDVGQYFSDLSWIDRYFETSFFNSSHSMTLTPVEPAQGERGPDIEITKSYYQSSVYEDAPLYLRLVVKNTGDMLAHVDTVSLNADVYEVIYKPESLYGGETSEIIVETKGKDISELKLTVEYFSDELGCLPTKNFVESFSLGSVDAFPLPSCRENGDCEGVGMDSPVCCRGACYDLGRGSCDDYDGDGTFEWSYY